MMSANRNLSHYKLISQIGAGGMGTVYLAEDTQLSRKVAIKFLKEELSEDHQHLIRFLQEAKAVSALNHPNILTIYEVGETDGTEFIAYEFVDGETLTGFLSHKLPDLIEILGILIQVAAALEAAHEAGIIHRDVKPDNLMVRTDGLVKVVDFGLAKANLIDSRLAEKIVSSPNMVMGTPNYMSPEQLRGLPIDQRTDIFSLGAVLYEMVSGCSPFAGETVSDTIAAVLTREPPPLREYDCDIPLELEEIVRRALHKDRSSRYQTVKDLLSDLKHLKQDLELQGHIELRRRFGSEEAKTQIFPVVVDSDPELISRSIAVLPFSEIGPERESEYFSEGLTEEITMNLSKLQLLKVVPRASVAHFVKTGKSNRQVGGELGVRYLLEGSVRRHAMDVRITVHLSDTIHDAYLWAETYRGTMDDIFDIQEKVAAEIVRALQVRITKEEEMILTKRYTGNTEAYQLYLQGRHFWNKRNEGGIQTAIKYFNEAIQKDPNYALAWAGIADSYNLLGEYGKHSRKELYPKALAAVTEALSIDDRLAEVHTSLASLLMVNEWNWDRSEREFQLAITLDPKYPTAHHWYSQWLLSNGRLEEALASISRAVELDPVSQAIVKDKGLIHYYAAQFDEAIALAQRTLELDPGYSSAHRLLSLCFQALGRYEEAKAENERWGALTGNRVESTIGLAQILAFSGQRQKALKALDLVWRDGEERENGGRGIALVYAGLKEIDLAFEWLEKSVEKREESILSLKIDFKFKALRSDSRYLALLKIIGLG